MKKNILNKSFALILTLIFTLAFTAALAEPTKVIIATEGAYAPYNYVNEDGSPDGYDIAVAKAVDELLEDYEFEYIPVEWSSIFAGLEADRYQVIVSQAAKTPEREEKYLFGDVAYSWTAGAIAFQIGSVTISLSGLAVASLVGVLLNAILPGNDYVFGKNQNGDTAMDLGRM
jgi:ABC-type amino acid transport substrate-binding protein